MKVITFPKPFLTADGMPFRRRQKDPKTGEFVQQKDSDGIVIRDQSGNALAVMENAEFPRVLKEFVETVFFLNRLDIEEAKGLKKEVPPELSLEDTSRATDIIRVANVALDGQMELEKASYEWLEGKVMKHGVRALGLDVAILHEIIKSATDGDTNRAERRREEKAKK